MVKHVQEAVNAVRKADNRVNKILADQHAKEQCWTSYVQKMQQAFVVERNKHQAMVEKLAQDLTEAKEQQRSTREALAQAATGTAKAPPKLEPAAEAEWLQLMTRAQSQTTDVMDVDVDTLGQQIAELLQPPAAPDGCPLSACSLRPLRARLATISTCRRPSTAWPQASQMPSLRPTRRRTVRRNMVEPGQLPAMGGSTRSPQQGR